MSAHRIIIEPGSLPQVECVAPAQCTGVVECREDHGEYEPNDDGEVYAHGWFLTPTREITDMPAKETP